jgi:hypothetical protein
MPLPAVPSPQEGGEGRVRGSGSRRTFLATIPQSVLGLADEVMQ